jgi:ribosomal protein L40E
MPNTKKDFSDKDFNCKRCRAHLATEKLDRQILVVGRLAIFNFASIVCMSCNALNLWQSPNLLPAKGENLLSRYPDSVRDLPKPEKRIINQLGIKGVTRTPNGKFKVRVIVGGQTKYLGCYSTIEAASKAYSKAKT